MRDAVGTGRSGQMREESERMRWGRHPCEGLWTCGDKVSRRGGGRDDGEEGGRESGGGDTGGGVGRK
jgi:hypothetical protein